MRQKEPSDHARQDVSRSVSVVLDPPVVAESWGVEELSATLESIGSGVWTLDLEGRCTSINHAACQILGYAREECLGQKLQCLIHGGHVDGWVCPKADCSVQKAIQSASAVHVDDDVFMRRDGTTVAVEYTVQPLVIRGCVKGAVLSMVDITARKSAEEARRKSDEWLGFAQQASGVGIFDADLKTGVTRVSREQFRLYGIDPAGDWPSHEEWRKLVHPEDRNHVDRWLDSAHPGASSASTEFRIVWPDGSVHWLHSQLRVFFDQAGKPMRQVGASVDITGHVRTETALNEFFSGSPTPLAVLSFDGRIRRSNPSWEALLGFSAAEMEGHALFDLVHPDDGASIAAEFEKLLVNGNRIGFECRARCKDGSYRWILVNAGVQRDSKVIYATIHDITNRKAIEEDLQASEARFRSAFDNNLFGIAITGPDGRFLQVNQNLCRITGFTAQELLQANSTLLTHPDDLPNSMKFMRSLLAGETPSQTITKRYICKDGQPIFVNVHAALVRNAQGAPLHFIVLVEDLTERKRAEESLRRTEEWLRFTLSAAGIGLFYRESGVTRASEHQFRLYGLEPAEAWISKDRWLQLIHADDRERVLNEHRLAAEKGETYDSQFRVTWPDETVHWLQCRGKLFQQDGAVRAAEITVDITGRKSAEAALEDLINVSRAPIAVIGFDGSIKRFNAALLQTSGFTAEELSSRPAIEFFHPDDRGTMQAEFLRLATQGGGAEFECRGVRKDGSIVWFLFSATAAPDEKSVFTIAYDITDRKRAEEELQYRNILLKTQQEASIDGILVVDENACIVSYNRRFLEMWGLPPKLVEDGRDRQVLQFVTEQLADPQQFLSKVNYLYEHRKEISRDEIVLADGRVFDRYSSPMFGPEERYYGRVWYFRDATESKRAEDELRQRESALSESQRIAHVGSWSWELPIDRNLNVWTPETYRILGVSPDTFVSSGENFRSLLHPEDRAAMGAWISACLAGEEPPDLEYRVNLPDGSLRHILGRGHLQRDAEGQPIRLTGIAQDITERKRMEEALRAHSEKLARSNEELERFAYVASHDLQEPLRMVASFTQLLSQRYSGRLDEKADQYINYAVDGAKRMQQLITDLLAFSRVNSKQLDLRPTDCATVLQGAVRNLQAAIEESGAAIDWDPLPVLWVDQGQVVQLFQNLIANAIKFRRKEECSRIHISAVEDPVAWTISVRDNGIGIDASQAERIFQIFQRLHTRQEYPGTGIGLAVCKKVVERHGGKLWVESEPGAGSTFRFTIPKPATNGIGDQHANQTGRDSVD